MTGGFSSILNYQSWDGQEWTATISGGGFHHYRKGTKPEQGHDDTRIDYVTWTDKPWSARFE